MTKYRFTAIIRKIGLIKIFDSTKFYIEFLRTFRTRKKFFKENPGVKLPPAYYIYETFQLNYFAFHNNSIETSEWLVSFFKRYKTLEQINILDWGCGPGRIIRHLPKHMDKTCNFYATDYNRKYINWCKKNIPDVSFSANQLSPPLDYKDNFFDIIYGISIFTHLSEDMHYKWFNELMRILKPQSILFITMHGEAFKVQLSETERNKFDKGDLVVKSKTKEGHRTFGAFHPEIFMKKLTGNNEVLEHIKGDVSNGRPQQDIWIIRKT